MISQNSLYENPNRLAKFYSMFRVSERILLSGHSHQAWPDTAFEAQKQAFLDAALYVDKKWELAAVKADEVRAGYSRLLDDENGYISLGENTFELIIRFLSALPFENRPKVVTTNGEFHTVRRLSDSLEKTGIEIKRIPHHPSDEVAEKMIEHIDHKTAVVIVSSVFYLNSNIVPGLKEIQMKCAETGAEFLIDAYHSLNVVPFSVNKDNLQNAFITGAGYKYCQLGEGNGFLRFPAETKLRPRLTGWFSEFSRLYSGRNTGEIFYGEGPAIFAGATYDPTSNYRAAAVFKFFQEQNLTPEFLREVSQHQIGLMIKLFDDFDFDRDIINRDVHVPLSKIGGFLALRTKYANELCLALNKQNVFTDARGDILRLGPAPYLCDDQIRRGMEILKNEIELISKKI